MRNKLLLIVFTATIVFVSCKKDAKDKIKEDHVAIAAERDEKGRKLPVIEFERTEHDFGNVVQGTSVETVFKFTNTGEAPLIITDAKSSCGCTIPEYPKDKAIAPGETGMLKVKFNGSGKNTVVKTVTVIANTEKGNERLKIKAFVEAPKEASKK